MPQAPENIIPPASGLRWFSSSLVSIPLPLPGGGIFPSPYPLPWGRRSPKRWLLGALALADFIKSESSCFWVVFPRLLDDPERRRKTLIFRFGPKSTKNKENRPRAAKISDFHRFWMTFGSHFGIDLPTFSDSLKVMNSLHRA